MIPMMLVSLSVFIVGTVGLLAVWVADTFGADQ